MSGGHGHGDSPLSGFIKEAWWFFIGIIVLWIMWFFTGGPQRAAQEGDMPFINAPQSLGGNGQVYDTNGNSKTVPNIYTNVGN